jgi:ethanolamine utilization protein EutN
MRVCKVIGYVVSTAKHPCLESRKILVVAALAGRGDPTVPMQLAVDGVGAGIGNEVIVSESGAAGRQVTGLEYPPVRSVIVGIVDAVGGK